MINNPQSSGSHPYRLKFQARGGTVKPEHTWIENFDLPVEAERGLSHRDHHLCVGEYSLPLNNCEWSGLTASLENNASPYIEEAMRRFFAYDDGVLARTQITVPELREAPDWIQQLALSADSFLFARPLADHPKGESAIAGYPWFGDWGRDTMIALPGLTLATGRYDSARHILQTFAQFIDQGMLPNVFPGHGETPEYNTVDAALWYIEAWRAYVDVTDDWSEFRKIFPVLEDIIRWYSEGTRYGIALDKQDGLLKAGEPGIQLTWMDAKVGDWVVTPRTGKAVEINALWYNALAIMANFARHTQVSAKAYEEQAAATKIGFQRFPYSPLDEATQQAVVKLCGKALLTSYGLRSLSADQPHYTPRYGGGVRERDSAYHQGTVWAWLLGHYALAEYKVSQDVNLSMHRLEPIRDHLFDAGLGTVSEIFDAEPPHAPNGTPAQAW